MVLPQPRKQCNFTSITVVVPRLYLQMIWRNVLCAILILHNALKMGKILQQIISINLCGPKPKNFCTRWTDEKKIALKNAEMVWNSWEHYLVMFASMLPWVPFPYHFQHCLEQFPFFFISPTCTKVLGFGPTQVSTYLFIFLKKSNVVMQIVTYSFVSS